jgi:hypothetical protein
MIDAITSTRTDRPRRTEKTMPNEQLEEKIEESKEMISYYFKRHKAAVEAKNMRQITLYERLIIAAESHLAILEARLLRLETNSRPTNDGG